MILATIAAGLLVACDDEPAEVEREVLAKDPMLSRALHDPLMVDPDLAWRNEANAVYAYRDGHPLPPFNMREDARERARDTARLELLDNGQIPALPAVSSGEGSASLADVAQAGDMVKAVGSRTDCIADMTEDLEGATKMPDTSSLMPHAMVQQAAGVDQGTCVIRVVRYLTPVTQQDALEYHFTKVDRARFRVERYETPEAQFRAERRDQAMAVHVREGPGGMTAVDIVHWRK